MSANRLLVPALALLLGAAPAAAGDPGFDRVVHEVSRHYEAKSAWGLGFLMWCAGLAGAGEPGVSHLKMRLFEGRTAPPDPGFQARLTQAAGPGFQPFVQAVSARTGETTLVLARPNKAHMDLLLVAAETEEAVVIRMTIDPEALGRWLEDPEGMARKERKRH